MYILGISCFYHDAAATLLRDGVVVAAALEERFTRKKHDQSFPIHAIRWCLGEAGIAMRDITAIGFYEKPVLKFERLLHQHLAAFPRSAKTFCAAMPSWFHEKLRVPQIIKQELGYAGDIYFTPHHLAHAASAFLVSPFDHAAIVTVDGVGEWDTTTVGVGRGHAIELTHRISFPHSLGLLYSTITAYLGFSVNNSEYKVMGLAAYGATDRSRNPWYQALRRTLVLREDGSYRLDLSYFSYHYADRMPAGKLCTLLGGRPRLPDEPVTDRHKDIAAAVQLVLEDAMTGILRFAHKVSGTDRVVLAGGVAQNSVYNGKIIRETPFREVWIQPEAGDGGASMGAAAYVYHTVLGRPRSFVMRDAYLGPAYAPEEIRAYLDEHDIAYRLFESDEALLEYVADLLARDEVVGWFQGRMEWGPRALGARSILANPCSAQMQNILNVKVKHREKFRPFAPAVCAEDAPIYFECDDPVPAPADFMLMVYPIRPEWRAKLPAVTHVDGSGRLQTVRRFANPRYYDLIKAFGRRSGIPMLVNTSFNIRGEPIVATPRDAYRCMMGTGIDALVMDRFLVRRSENVRDQWDSEAYAID